ncbi:MAG: hypothetical protein LBR45_00840 [Bacteroidales bacterium]|jgi:hypothetical protein|nr:hypothetical protein [Bacteroidales bacterium]
MKHSKILFAVAFLFCCNLSFAQFFIGAGGGVGVTSTNRLDYGAYNGVDYKFQLFAGYFFPDSIPSTREFGIQTGVEYEHRNMMFVDLNKGSRTNFYYTELSSKVPVIKIPIMLAFRDKVSKKHPLYINWQVGFWFAAALNSSGEIKGYTVNEDIYAKIDNIFSDKKVFTGYDFEPLKKFSFGARLLVGFEFYGCFLNWSMDCNATRMYNSKISSYPIYADITLGYRFKFRG